MESTSSSLLERLRQPGQQPAWARFVELYSPLLHTWATGRGLSDADALDLVQDVLAVLIVKLPHFTYDPKGSFRGWLKNLARNVWVDKQRQKQAKLPLQFTAPDNLDGVAQEDSAERFWEEEYRSNLVARALQIMQRDFKTVTWKACWGVVVNGRSAAEVAAELGLTVGAVHAAKFRVLQRLRQELKGLLD